MFGFLSKNKGPFTATVQPTGQQITIKGGSSENLLKAALENGINWPYNCRVGSCGTCKCKLVSGKIKPLNDFSYVLTKEEMDAGYILACQTMLKSDIEVEVAIEAAQNGVAVAKARRIQGAISRAEPLTHDILEVAIELDGKLNDYMPGQYADIVIPGIADEPRSYSFSKSPAKENPNEVSFFIRRVPKGKLTEWLHSGNHVGQRRAAPDHPDQPQGLRMIDLRVDAASHRIDHRLKVLRAVEPVLLAFHLPFPLFLFSEQPDPHPAHHIVGDLLDAHPVAVDGELGAFGGQILQRAHDQPAKGARGIGRQIPLQPPIQTVYRDPAVHHHVAIGLVMDAPGVLTGRRGEVADDLLKDVEIGRAHV